MRFPILIVVIGLSSLSHAAGQDASPATGGVLELNVVQGGDEGGALILGSGGGSEGFVLQAPMISVGGVGGVGGYVPTDRFNMLNLSQFQEELEIVEEQQQQLKELRERMTAKRRDLYASIRSIDRTKVGDYMREAQGLIQDEINDELQKILLPHQLERLGQLETRMKLRNQGLNALAGPDMAEMLGLTDEQRKQLAEKQKEAAAELQKQIEEIRASLQKEVLEEVLNAEQRKKLEQVLGKEYAVKPRTPIVRGPKNGPEK